jgi:hypothetical protein
MVAVAPLLVCGQLLGHDTGVVLAGFVEADHWGERMLVPGQVLSEIQRLGEVEDVEAHCTGEGPLRTEVARSENHGHTHGQLHGRVHP